MAKKMAKRTATRKTIRKPRKTASKRDRYPWHYLDDNLFVYLAADMLASLGFLDIQPQGSGPDGGLDLIGTEQLRFAVQGPTPFRWGVQCKFSTTGRGGSVNDQDIQDVEGILRSSRFASENLRGYLLITNRRVSQNVVERLAGTDRASQFRTAIMDGAVLQHHLDNNPRLVSKYFNPSTAEFRAIGTPTVVKSGETYLTIPITLATSKQSVTIEATIDTGATVTVVPRAIMDALGIAEKSRVRLSTGFSSVHAESCMLNVTVGEYTCVGAQVVATDFPRAILGLNILQQLILFLDGPSKVVKLWSGA